MILLLFLVICSIEPALNFPPVRLACGIVHANEKQQVMIGALKYCRNLLSIICSNQINNFETQPFTMLLVVIINC